MSASSSTSLVRGCCAHKDAIEAVQREQRKVGTGGAPYLEAVAALEAMQRRLDWQAPQGVVDSDGVGRKLSVQLLKHRWSHVETGGGLLLTWAKLKERLKSHCYEKKEDAPLFLLVKFYNDGFEKRSFFKRGGVHRVGGISRCRENVEWVDGLTLDFDAGLTVEQFVERYGSYEYLIYSSFNHAPLDGKNKFRVVMPLKDRVRPVEIENRRRSLMELFKDADPASFSISQGFYIPTHPTGIEPVRVENPGEWFDLMELEVMPRSKPAFASSIKVIADGDAPGVIAALMNCMPPDTECLRELPGTNGHSYAPVIVPLLSSLGFWGREQGMDEEDIHELVMQRWGMSPHSDSFYRLICGATYGGLECGQSFVERVGRAVSQGIDLGIPKDEFERARDELNGLLKQQVEVRPVEVMDLDAATNKLQNLLLQRMYGYGNQDSYRNHLIIRYEAGAGKTKHAHTMLWLSMMIQKPPRGENRYWVVDYLVPDNTLGGEIAKRLRTESKDRGVHVQHIQGRKQLCIDPKVKEAEGLGYEVRSPCEGCTYVSECEYLKQYQQPKGEHWIRVLYQGMASNQKAKYDPIESPDFFVVDEDMVTSMYAEREYGHVYGFIREMPASLNAKSTSAEIRNAIGGSLRPEVKELRGREDKNSSLPAVQFSKFRKGDIDRDEFRRQLEAKRNKEAKREGKRSVADCSALLDDLMHRPQAVSVREGADGVRSIISSSLRPLASRYAQSPCIYLDATAEKLVIERALCDHEGAGRGIDYWECNVAYSPSVKVYQDTSRSWSMQSLCPRAKGKREVNEVLLSFVWDEMVRRSFLAGKRFAIVTYKAVAEYIDSGRTPPGSLSLKESPLFCGVGHFGNIRGLEGTSINGMILSEHAIYEISDARRTF
ncbi:hypothetical protein H5P28_10190 [Ruficoccus amylovorans]|uniref:Uncharacterized protein n=1 Tax=Ruficoccus amylovorans TaxID=1804625 RepID=A0A842HF09_9BACT|nr:hypothetical protein [Ruficoccus amylovorans]MBC2594628.1 hypothetical protein [Ruficoccus amylovorans]